MLLGIVEEMKECTCEDGGDVATEGVERGEVCGVDGGTLGRGAGCGRGKECWIEDVAFDERDEECLRCGTEEFVS